MKVSTTPLMVGVNFSQIFCNVRKLCLEVCKINLSKTCFNLLFPKKNRRFKCLQISGSYAEEKSRNIAS